MNALMRLCSAAILLVCASVPAYSSARAQGIEVVPVNVQLAPGQQAATLTVTNRNPDKVSFQVRGFRWQQDGQGNVWAIYTDFAWIAKRHGITSRDAQFTMASGVVTSITSTVKAN